MFIKSLRCVVRNTKTRLICHRMLSNAIDAAPNIESSELPNRDTKILKVAIIGTPNAGKSTLINNLMDRKVCATSRKVHTTRCKARAVFTVDDAQIVFIDTPGIINDKEKKKFNLERAFLKDSRSVFMQADIVGVIHDVSDVWRRERLDIKIINLLSGHPKVPSFLVMNKVDALKSKRKLLDLTRQLTDNCLNGKPIPGTPDFKKDNTVRGWTNFQEIFMVSALTGSGLEEVKNYLIKRAKPGEWVFPEDIWTDQKAEKIITNAVQAELLNFLPQEIPYNLKPVLEFFDVNEKGVVTAAVTIICPSERIAKLAMGSSEGRLKQISESLQQNLQDTFKNYVRLTVVMKGDKAK